MFHPFVRATPPEEFSQCSVNDLETLLMDNVGHCLFNIPTKVHCKYPFLNVSFSRFGLSVNISGN
jgi:hypothetical protein